MTVSGQCGCHSYLDVDHTFAIPGPASFGEVVDGSKLDKSGEDEGITDCYEPVHGCGIRHLGQRVTGTDAKSGHGQHGGHTYEER